MSSQTASLPMPTSTRSKLQWSARLIAAAILFQTLFFKFTAAPESVYIFEQLGVEPWGRIGSGIVEAIAIALMLVPGDQRITAFGGLLTMGVMGGAIGSHLTKLGIEVQGDGGTLFALAMVTLLCGAVVTWGHRRGLPFFGFERSRDLG